MADLVGEVRFRRENSSRADWAEGVIRRFSKNRRNTLRYCAPRTSRVSRASAWRTGRLT